MKIIIFSTLLLFYCSFGFAGTSQQQSSTNNQSTTAILQKIESKMKSIKTLECNFVQEKKLSILNKPIIISGKIYIQSPGYFAWHGEKPVKYSMVIKGHTLQQWDEDSDNVITIDLDSKPIFQVLISQMQSWFSGNYVKQAEDYNISVISKDPLTLKFTPKPSSSTTEFVKSVKIKFKKDLSYISNITIREKSGDSMSMTFSNTKLNSDIPENVWSVD